MNWLILADAPVVPIIPNFNQYAWDSWANSQAVRMFLAGLITSVIIRLFRAGLKWFKKAGTDTNV